MLLKGDLAVDDRGKVSFVNDFNFKNVKRFYIVENHTKGFVRAWHGHKHEDKYVLVTRGAALVLVVPLEGVFKMDRYVLSSDKPQILHIPAGNYNGFKTLTDDTQVMFFSSATLAESMDDDIRQPADRWSGAFEVEER